MAHPYKNTPLFAAKGGGTTKVCLPKSKVARMSPEEKKKVHKHIRVFRYTVF